jgi:hypothetical protein
MPASKSKGFIQVPHYVLDAKNLKPLEKLVLIALKQFAYGDKEFVRPSQVTLSKRLGMDRKTVRESLAALLDAGYIEPAGKRGQVQIYRLRFSEWPRLASAQPGESTPANLGIYPHQPGESTPTNKSNEENKKNTTQNPLDDPTTNAADAAIVDSLKSHKAMPHVTKSGGDISPGQTLPELRPTRAIVNQNRLTPSGSIASDDKEIAETEVMEALAVAGGSGMDTAGISFLINRHGAREVTFQSVWLLRRITNEHRKGEIVRSAEGFLRRAISEGWDVNPEWPHYGDCPKPGRMLDPNVPFSLNDRKATVPASSDEAEVMF